MFPHIHKNFSDLKPSQDGPLSLLCRVMTRMFSNREIVTNRMYTVLSTCPAKNYDNDIETKLYRNGKYSPHMILSVSVFHSS
jgi:hypothetical protein